MADTSKVLQKFYRPTLIQIRTLIKNYVSPGGIEYVGFKYHPRHPDFKDPPYERSKLFFVTRIKSVAGTNPIEREALQKLNIDGHIKQNGHKAVVKNIPEVNSLLWKIKHLVVIKPIVCPQGLPKDGDYSGTYLHDNGRFEVAHKLKVPQERLEAANKFIKSEKLMGPTVMKKFLRQRWNNAYQGSVHEQQ